MAWIRNRPLGLVYRDAELASDAYTLYCHVRGKHADLLDAQGRTVHQWQNAEGIQHVKLLPNGNLLCHTTPPLSALSAETIGGSSGVLRELGPDSEVVWEYRDDFMHHDFHRLDNGNTLVLRWDKIPADVSARVQGGHVSKDDPDWMWGDVVREVAPDGSTVREWRSWEHLHTEQHVKCPLESREEWTHANSIELTPDGDWLISFRLTDSVVVVDKDTGDVKWRWGPGVLSHQHHASWLENGNVLIFDNGCHRKDGPSFSKVIEVDPKTKKVEWEYKAPTILAFYSFMISGAQRLPSGNTFICEGASGRMFEVTPEGETVWEYVSPWMLSSPYGPTCAVFRAYRIASDDPRLASYTLDHEPFAEHDARIAAYEPRLEDAEPGYVPPPPEAEPTPEQDG